MKSAEEIRMMARNKLSGNLGTGILITIVPPIIAAVLTAITGFILGFSPLLSSLVSTAINAMFMFMVYKMIIEFVKDHEVDFMSSLGPQKTVLQYLAYAFIFFAIGYVINIPVNLIMYGEAFITQSDALIQGADMGTPDFQMLGSLYLYIFLTWVILFIVTLRLYLVEYLIVDFDMTVVEAMQESWKLTSGQVGRIIWLNLTFIGWYLLVIVTCGLAAFYVVPYHTTATTYLYFEILDENGKGHKRAEKFDAALQGDWVEVEDTPEQKQEKQDDSWDF